MQENMTERANRRFKPVTAILILLIHLAALLAFHPYFFSWTGVVLFAILVWATASLGISMCYHRLLSHRSYKAKPGLRNTLALFASMALQGGPITWSATHRLHHRESDHEDDPHSPLVNFLWSHMLWLFFTHPVIDVPGAEERLAPDLAREPVLRFLNRYFFAVWAAFAALSFGAGYLFGGVKLGWSLVIWGSCLRTVWVWHITWFVNSVTHLFGYRNYKTADDSRNLWWVALLTFGEGWHNNHHAVAGSAKFGRRWWEVDPTFWVLRAFQSFGWAWKVNIAEKIGPDGPQGDFSGKTQALSKALKSALNPEKHAHA